VTAKVILAAFKKIKLKAMVNITFLMDPNILANGITIYQKDMDLKYSQTVRNMLAVGAREKRTVTVNFILKTGVIIKDNFLITSFKEKDNIITAKSCI
jgi:hypothetical protein